jgi:thiamine transporter ThiT
MVLIIFMGSGNIYMGCYLVNCLLEYLCELMASGVLFCSYLVPEMMDDAFLSLSMNSCYLTLSCLEHVEM